MAVNYTTLHWVSSHQVHSVQGCYSIHSTSGFYFKVVSDLRMYFSDKISPHLHDGTAINTRTKDAVATLRSSILMLQ